MAATIAPLQAETLLTGDDLLAMGDIGPSELIEGRLVRMSPTGGKHAIIEVNFAQHLKVFAVKHRLGKVMSGEVGIYVRRNPDTIRAADVAYISNERYARWRKTGYLDVAPDLIVEILSPDDRWTDVTQKLREYFGTGVRLVWVADPEARMVYAYRSSTDVREFKETDTLTGDDVLPGFNLIVADLFEE